MSTSLYGYAQQIVMATRRIADANNPQDALDALASLDALIEDHTSVHMLAETFCLLVELLPDNPPGS